MAAETRIFQPDVLGRKRGDVALSKVFRRHGHHKVKPMEGIKVMTGQKNTQVNAVEVDIPKTMPIGELFEQLQRIAEQVEEERFDEETREPCDCPVCHEDKDTIVKEAKPAPFDKWRHYTDMLADLHDIILQLASDAYEYGDLNLERRSVETLNSVISLTEQFANMRRKAEKQ